MRRPLAGLLVAEAVSQTGSRVSNVAVPWLVLVTTGSATQVGVVALAQTLPTVLAGMFGGPLVDRAGPRRVAIAADTAGAAVIGLVPLLHLLGWLSLGPLIAVVAVAGTLAGCGDTAKRALLPPAAQDTPLARAAGLFEGVSRAATLVGLPLGGVLIAALGPAVVLVVDAASFAVCAALLAATVRVDARPERPTERYLTSLREGIAYFRGDTLVLAVVGLFFVTNLVDQAYNGVFVPVWVRATGAGEATLGLLGGAFGVGAVLGALVHAALATRLPRRRTLAVCLLLAGSPRLFTLAGTDDVRTALAVSFGAGVAMAAVNPILMTVGYERVPDHLRGRVLGAIGAIGFAGIPLGGLLGGLLADAAGLRAALLTGGLLYLAATVTPFLLPQWRRLDDRVAVPAHAAASDG